MKINLPGNAVPNGPMPKTDLFPGIRVLLPFFTGNSHHSLKQYLRVMKITTLILILALTQLSAKTFSQIRLAEKNVPLEKVLKLIQHQTNTSFFYDRRDIKDVKVSIIANNISLKEALDQCLANTQIVYEIEESTVFISIKKPAIIQAPAIPFNAIDIRGQVVDENGVALESAVVKVTKKTGNGYITLTDKYGKFYLKNQDEKSLITITMLGYLEKELGAKADMGIIRMQVSNTTLDQVRVVAYGENTRRFSVGSVSTITSKDIEKQPVTNVLLALQGQVPGLVISPSSGAPGAEVRMQIRGQSTMGQSVLTRPYDQPLVIVDGIPLATQNNNINQLAAFGGSNPSTNLGGRYAGGLSPFGTVNPADIESISVLRDADATSIYGSQGANGVILITTKKGKPGRLNLDLSVNTGVNIATQQVEMLNTEQYLALRREAFANDKVTPQGTNQSAIGFAPDLFLFDQNKNTDWVNYLMGNTSWTTNVNASVSGGNELSNYVVSGGFTTEGYNFPGNFKNDRMTLHSNFQFNSLNKKLKVDIGTDIGYNNNNSTLASSVGRNIITPPNYPDLLDAQGNLLWNYKGYSLSTFQIFGPLKQLSEIKALNTNNNVKIAYQIIPDLSLSAIMGYSRFSVDEHQRTPLSSQSPGATNSSAQFGKSLAQTINIEPLLNYKKTFGKGQLSFLLGGTYKQNISQSELIRGTGYGNDGLLGSIKSAATVNIINDISTVYKYVAGFAKIGYIYNQKYIASLTGRRDGSSNFGVDRQFGNFGSVGLGWIFSEEPVVKKNLPFLSYAKLAGNIGTSGLDQAPGYQFQPNWGAASGANPFQGIQPLTPQNVENRTIGWNLKKSINLEMDLGFINDRILLNATWYRSRASRQLLQLRLPDQVGFGTVFDNSPATVQNTGLEFTFTTRNITSKNFQWTSNFNISKNRNSLYAFPDLESSSYASSYTVGESIGVIYGFNYKGVNPQTGVFEFYDSKGNAVVMPKVGRPAAGGDYVPIYDPQPRFFGGLTNTFTYKNISLSFLLQFSKQDGINYLGGIYGDVNAVIPGGLGNLPVQILDRWQKPGDITSIPKLTANNQANFDLAVFNFLGSSGAYSDASYIRMKNVSFSYALPSSLLQKLMVRNVKLFVNAQNLFVISGFEVGDPESAGSIFSYPLQRTITGGLSINL